MSHNCVESAHKRGFAHGVTLWKKEKSEDCFYRHQVNCSLDFFLKTKPDKANGWWFWTGSYVFSLDSKLADSHWFLIVMAVPSFERRITQPQQVKDPEREKVKVLVGQACPTLCDPMDCSPPGSSVRGDSLGQNTGVGCHALLQGIFPTQGWNPCLLHCRRILHHLSHQTSSKDMETLNQWCGYCVQHRIGLGLWSSLALNTPERVFN